MMPKIDLRTKLFFLILAPLFIYLELNLFFEILVVLIYLSVFVVYRDFKWAGGFLLLYGSQLAILFFRPNINLHPFFMFTLSFLGIGFRRMMLSIISGAVLLKTTSISEWLSLLNKWHIPRNIRLGIAVLIRFVPTIIHDYRIIKRAMAIRGIHFNFGSLIRHPVRSFEYIIIPLLINTSFNARDLTISALTKGLNKGGPQTSFRTYRMTAVDYAYIVILSLAIAGGFLL